MVRQKHLFARAGWTPISSLEFLNERGWNAPLKAALKAKFILAAQAPLLPALL